MGNNDGLIGPLLLGDLGGGGQVRQYMEAEVVDILVGGYGGGGGGGSFISGTNQ